MLVDDQGIAEQRRVTVSDLIDGNRVIETGLKPGEKVITSGMQRAIPGQKVTAETARP
jgi:multidrug efflux pump subunit AcrA (membrane-fusion protein)